MARLSRFIWVIIAGLIGFVIWSAAEAQQSGEIRWMQPSMWGFSSSMEGSNVALSPDGRHIAYIVNDLVVLIRARDGAMVRTMRGFADHVHISPPLRFSPDGQLVAAVVSRESERRLGVWRVSDGEFIGDRYGHFSRSVSDFDFFGMVFGDSARLIAIADGTDTVKIVNLNPRTGYIQSFASLRTGYPTHRVRWATAGVPPRIATAGDDRVDFWRPSDGYRFWSHTFNEWVYGIEFSSDSNLLACGLRDRIAVLRVNNGTLLHTLPLQTPMPFFRFAFSPAVGSNLLAVCTQQRLQLWDASTGSLVSTLAQNPDLVAQFSQDGRLLLSGQSESGTPRFVFYRIPSGERAYELVLNCPHPLTPFPTAWERGNGT